MTLYVSVYVLTENVMAIAMVLRQGDNRLKYWRQSYSIVNVFGWCSFSCFIIILM